MGRGHEWFEIGRAGNLEGSGGTTNLRGTEGDIKLIGLGIEVVREIRRGTMVI